MPYRLRLFDGDTDRLLVTTTHDSLEGAGVRAADFPPDELMKQAPDGSGSASIRREVTVIDEEGNERPATHDEEEAVFEAIGKRMEENAAAAAPPCLRCGLRPLDHPDPYPVRGNLEGVIYFACWTPEEKDEHLGPSD
jgi:hypothetical protein